MRRRCAAEGSSGWGAGAVLRRQLRETASTPGLAWLAGVTALVPAAAVLGVAALASARGDATEAPLLLRAWSLPATTLVGLLAAVLGATSVAGRAEAAVLDAMRRHGVARSRVLAGKLGAAVVTALTLAVTALPAAALPLAFGRLPAAAAALAAGGIGLAAIVGAAVGVAVGVRTGEVRRAVVTAALVMALPALAVAVSARVGAAVLLG